MDFHARGHHRLSAVARVARTDNVSHAILGELPQIESDVPVRGSINNQEAALLVLQEGGLVNNLDDVSLLFDHTTCMDIPGSPFLQWAIR